MNEFSILYYSLIKTRKHHLEVKFIFKNSLLYFNRKEGLKNGY